MNEILFAKEITPESAKVLIAAGANINYKNKDGYTPLYYACRNKNYDLVKFLIENGAVKTLVCWDTTEEIKKYLVQSDFITSNNLIIKYGTDEQKSKIEVIFEEACEHFELTKIYINQGGDINKQCKNGRTLLHYAVEEKNIEWVKYLVDKGADQKIKNNNEEVPVNLFSPGELYEFMIENINESDNNGEFPAKLLTYCKIYEILKENINEPDKYGKTILHKYVNIRNYFSMIRFLIRIGARFDIKDKNGNTAYDLAKDKNIFKTKEEQIDEVVGKDIKFAIKYLLTKIY